MIISTSSEVQVDTPADVADLVGGYEGRARAEGWVDDAVAAIGEVEERVREHRGRLGGRVVLQGRGGRPKARTFGPRLSRERAEPSPTPRLSQGCCNPHPAGE